MSKDKKLHICVLQGVGVQFITTSMAVAIKWEKLNSWNITYFNQPIINSFKEALKKAGYSPEQIKDILCQTKKIK